MIETLGQRVRALRMRVRHEWGRLSLFTTNGDPQIVAEQTAKFLSLGWGIREKADTFTREVVMHNYKTRYEELVQVLNKHGLLARSVKRY